MLGVRLPVDTENDLAAFARRTRRSKSDIARDAVREYLDRHRVDEEFRRQLRLIAAATSEDDLALVDERIADLLHDEPDHDWGVNEP